MTAPTQESDTHRSRLSAYVPGVRVLRSYPRAWLPRDVVAGLVLSALLVPQGMAYAELAGLPPITGLYTSILCLLGYAVFGPSRVLVLGPDSSLGPMIAATIVPLMLADGDPARAITDVSSSDRSPDRAASRTLSNSSSRPEVSRSRLARPADTPRLRAW